ncbi:MAG: glycyl radical protein [candidate division WOR-3 bacterium]|nr:MAG: glycyl radical protein [candidate division WOR-3 bacterium]
MTERILRLRQKSITTQPYVSSERAQLLTEFYKKHLRENTSPPVTRALAFKYILEHKEIFIDDGELIVGERGPGPRGAPTYPELCCHTLQDLDILNSRKKTRFQVSDDARKTYETIIIPFWQGKTLREKLFNAMSEKWKDAFHAGIFTEFMEQRSPGHAIMDDKIYHKGLLQFKEEITRSRAQLDPKNDPQAQHKEQELRAMDIAADALISFARRHAEKARELMKTERDETRKTELATIAQICAHVPAQSPRNFWEALQMYWFIHLGVITELNVWDSFNPGRLDVNLYPFFKKDLADGSLTKESAVELLQCFWIKFNNQPAPPKVGVTEEQSATYQDFSLINTGGILKDGSDAVNELSFLILDVLEEMHMMMPSTCVQLSKYNPEDFLLQAVRVVKKGFGQPSFFNTDAIIQEFLRAGKTLRDARQGGPSGCVTISAFGKESCTLTGYMNWPKILEIALHDGKDPNTGIQLGTQTGDPQNFDNFGDLLEVYKKQLRYFVDLKIEGNSIIERLYAEHMPAPFMSLLTDDCISRGKDYHDGGPRYNVTYIQGVGMGTITDALSAIQYLVYDHKMLTMDDLLRALDTNFADDERVRQILLNVPPKYGNDDDYVDALARAVFDAYFEVLDGRDNTKGDKYRVNLLPTTAHIYFGQMTGATANGRKAGEPLSDGVSPSQGADHNGPTAVIKSVAKIDHLKTGGTLLNQKFLPDLLKDEAGLCNLAHLIRAYFRLNGHHIQFNVIDAQTLRDAQEYPDKYRDLIVRVAGYSDYFVDLGKDLQNEIISRTEQS